jgi:hypothetical protein
MMLVMCSCASTSLFGGAQPVSLLASDVRVPDVRPIAHVSLDRCSIF